MDKKIRNKLMYSLENALDELYMMEKNSNFKTHQKQEAADTVNAFIRVYNYYTKPEDQITLLKLLDCDRFDEGLEPNGRGNALRTHKVLGSNPTNPTKIGSIIQWLEYRAFTPLIRVRIPVDPPI